MSPGWNCFDCDMQTRDEGEYYMIHDDIWNAVGAGYHMLCVGCLEFRMFRLLTPEDFTDCALNSDMVAWPKSDRLMNRLGY